MLLSFGAACSNPKTADDIEPCAKTSANTAGSALKTGGTTALAGIETFGASVGGLLDGGTDEAKKKWKEGAEQTKQTANEGSTETKATAQETDCK